MRTLAIPTALVLVLSMAVIGMLDRIRLGNSAKASPPQNAKLAKAAAADNSACYVCHLNYEQEPLVAVHARNRVACTHCHGDCWDHADDEDNITAPDIMFPPDSIDAACQKCHARHDVPARQVLARWQQRCATKVDPATINCTDCHGQHRLKRRTVQWDRKTGRLIVQGDQRATSGED